MKVYKTEQEAAAHVREARADMAFSDNDTFTVEQHSSGYVICMFSTKGGRENFCGYF